ncbi:class I SAM-dependent DNA methyltransferase [Roseobacteraceae bacterium NS-SX3]
MKKQTPGLSDAYALSTPEESRRLYAEWAASYDQDFAATQQYLLPAATARAFAAAGGHGPVLDAGAGTGLCGVALNGLGIAPVDAADISPEMLAEALRKDVYRDVIEADLLKGIPMPRGYYSGVVSAGTFTHGHVGPDALPALLRVAGKGAQFALAINAKFYEKAGFATAFDRLLRGQWIRGLTLPEVPIYGAGGGGAHQEDTALIALFQKV